MRLWRELLVGVLLGIVCSIVLGLMTFLLTWNAGMVLTTPVSLLIVLCFAAIVGSAVPILLKKANIDPALAIGPFITTMNDLVGVWIYLTIAFQVGDWLLKLSLAFVAPVQILEGFLGTLGSLFQSVKIVRDLHTKFTVRITSFSNHHRQVVDFDNCFS